MKRQIKKAKADNSHAAKREALATFLNTYYEAYDKAVDAAA